MNLSTTPKSIDLFENFSSIFNSTIFDFDNEATSGNVGEEGYYRDTKKTNAQEVLSAQ